MSVICSNNWHMLIGCHQPKRTLQQIDVRWVCLLWIIKWTQWTSILSIGHVYWSLKMNTLCLLCPLVTNGHFQHFGTWPMDGSMDAHWTFIGHGHCTQRDECTQWAPPTILVALLPIFVLYWSPENSQIVLSGLIEWQTLHTYCIGQLVFTIWYTQTCY